jgi:archaellum biogenesis ATPase FlaH
MYPVSKILKFEKYRYLRINETQTFSSTENTESCFIQHMQDLNLQITLHHTKETVNVTIEIGEKRFDVVISYETKFIQE